MESIIDKALGTELDDSAFFKIAEGEENEIGFSLPFLFDTAVKGQIDARLTAAMAESRPRDFMRDIADRIGILRLRAETDDIDVQDIESAYSSILQRLIALLEEKFDFDYSECTECTPDSLDSSTLEAHACGLYAFMIIERVDIMVEFLENYISSHRNTLASRCAAEMEKRKDVVLGTLADQFEKEDALILLFLKEIAEELASGGISFGDLVTAVEVEREGEVSLEVAKKVFDAEDFDIVKIYMAPLLADDELMSTVVSRVRMGLVELFPQKKQKE